MSLHRLVYLSRARENLSLSVLNDLSLNARKRNEIHQITSLLMFDGRYFLHYAEGPAASLTWLLDNVRQDKRHNDLCLLSHHPCQTRIFPDWPLNIVDLSHFAGKPIPHNQRNSGHPEYSIHDLLQVPLPGDMRLLVASFAAGANVPPSACSELDTHSPH